MKSKRREPRLELALLGPGSPEKKRDHEKREKRLDERGMQERENDGLLERDETNACGCEELRSMKGTVQRG